MIDVEIEDEAWTAAEPDATGLVTAAAAASLRHASLAHDREGDIAILLADDGRVQALNARFRSKDTPTNVLSFPAPQAAGGGLGDIILAFGVCAREAAEQGKPLADHLRHLAAHGVLHLLGYDHETDAKAESMEALERAIMAELGVPDPYAERDDPGDHGQRGQ